MQEQQNNLWKLVKQFWGDGGRGWTSWWFCWCPPDKQHFTFRVCEPGVSSSSCTGPAPAEGRRGSGEKCQRLPCHLPGVTCPGVSREGSLSSAPSSAPTYLLVMEKGALQLEGIALAVSGVWNFHCIGLCHPCGWREQKPPNLKGNPPLLHPKQPLCAGQGFCYKITLFGSFFNLCHCHWLFPSFYAKPLYSNLFLNLFF